jgi:tetratricopeptide (TPR) repeat protein
MNIFKFFDKLLLNSPSYREGAVVGLINYCMNAYEEAKRTVPGKDPHLYLAMVNSLLLKMQGGNTPLYKHKDAENLVMLEVLLHRNTVYSACVPWPACVKVLVYMSLLDTHRGFSEDFLKPPYNEEYEELVSPLCAMDREILEQFYRENNPNSNYLDENYFKQMTMRKAIDEGSSSDITLPEEAEFFLKNMTKGVAFTRMIDMNPKSAVAYCHRGVTHINGRSYKLAIEDFDKAIELNPKFAEAYSNREVAYARLGMRIRR